MAIGALGRLATIDNFQVAVAVGDALSDLVVDAEELAGQVLAALETWAKNRKQRTVAHLCFLKVAGDLTTSGEDVKRDFVSRPTLLELVQRDEELRDSFFALWISVLNDSLWIAYATSVLADWGRQAEDDPELRNTFTRMVRELARRDLRARSVLARIAKNWDDGVSLVSLPAVARAMNAVLKIEQE
jgi:hypothetical protein